MSGVRGIMLAGRLLSELALFAVLAVAGARAGAPMALRVALAVIAPVAGMVVWGLLLAPRSRRRLADPARLVVEIVLFALAAAALAGTGPVMAALVFAVAAIGLAVADRLTASAS